MELAGLLEEIEAVCHLDVSKGLMDRICFVLGIQKVTQQDLFLIENEDLVIRAASQEEFKEYVEKIFCLEELEELVEKLEFRTEYRDEISGILRQIRKMVNDIRIKARPEFDEEEDNAEKLGEYVGKKILEKHIHKISTSLYNGMRVKNGGQEVLADIINGVNRYLSRLGVYTVIAQVGEPYKNVENYYTMVNSLQESNPNPVVERVECPAYAVDYLNEDGEVFHYCADGTCIGK